MTDKTFDADIVCSLTRNWWAFVLRGVIALVIAVLAWLMPAGAVLALAIVFGAFAFADGVFGLVSAVRNIREGERWGWLAVSGAVGIATGAVVLVAPLVATLALAVFLWASIAFWAIVSGIFELVAAVRLRKEIAGEIWLGLGGLISIVLGALIVWLLFTRPAESLLALGWVLGFYAAIFGVAMIVLGLRLRKLHEETGGASGTVRPPV
ncbi:MAG: HdeD family acid-resistance protein [Roseovarius sp.]|jgi:uncharacterized membrane protein HdeD (DUF308 family)|nr:HdeD family acid-resistance protein [Roseovarius sp.]